MLVSVMILLSPIVFAWLVWEWFHSWSPAARRHKRQMKLFHDFLRCSREGKHVACKALMERFIDETKDNPK